MWKWMGDTGFLYFLWPFLPRISVYAFMCIFTIYYLMACYMEDQRKILNSLDIYIH